MTAASRQPRLRIGIDTGGTFTDIVAVDSGSGAMHVTKVASTPANPAIGAACPSSTAAARSPAATSCVEANPRGLRCTTSTCAESGTPKSLVASTSARTAGAPFGMRVSMLPDVAMGGRYTVAATAAAIQATRIGNLSAVTTNAVPRQSHPTLA